jgi:hypothetical protein
MHPVVMRRSVGALGLPSSEAVEAQSNELSCVTSSAAQIHSPFQYVTVNQDS